MDGAIMRIFSVKNSSLKIEEDSLKVGSTTTDGSAGNSSTIATTTSKDEATFNILFNELGQGYGEISSLQGRYKGGFYNGLFCGTGELHQKNGHVYVGEFKNGLYNGNGTFTDPDGLVARGYFRGGQQHGPFSITYVDGSMLEAIYEKGNLVSCSKLKLENGAIYECEKGEDFVKIIKQIAPALTQCKIFEKKLADGSFYKGPLAMNDFHGEGKLFFPNGKLQYEGEFQLGYYNGPGKLYCYVGAVEGIFKGHFVNGHLEGTGTYELPPRLKYQGDFKKTQFHGYGILEQRNNNGREVSVYEGFFQNNNFHGKGAVKMTMDGNIVKVDSDHGKLTGQALLSLNDGRTIADEYTDNVSGLLQGFADAPDLRPSRLNTKEENLKIKTVNLYRKSTKKFIEQCKGYFEEIRLEVCAEIQKEAEKALTKVELIEKRKKEKAEEDKALDELVRAIEGSAVEDKTVSKGKGKAKKAQKERLTHASSSSKESAHEPSPTVVAEPSYLSPRGETPRCHKRILRWQEKEYQKIQEFSDFRQGQIVNLYAGMTIDEIKMQRMYHFMPSLERLLGKNNEHHYYTKTNHSDHTEYHFMAVLMPDGSEDSCEFGDIVIAVNHQGTIYHKKFDPWTFEDSKLANFKSRFFESTKQELPEAKSTSEEGAWEPVGSMSVTTIAHGYIELSFKDESHKVRISPLWHCS